MYRIAETVRIVPARDGQILLDIGRGQVLHLNATAALIIEELQRGRNEGEISEVIAHQFNVSREAVNRDVAEFMKSLADRGLLRSDSGKTGDREKTRACDFLSGER